MAIKQLTREDVFHLSEYQWWKHSNDITIATFQLTQEVLICPIDVYKQSLTNCLKRQIFTHELSDPKNLLNELLGNKVPPTLDEILLLLPSDKTMVVKFHD